MPQWGGWADLPAERLGFHLSGRDSRAAAPCATSPPAREGEVVVGRSLKPAGKKNGPALAAAGPQSANRYCVLTQARQTFTVPSAPTSGLSVTCTASKSLLVLK